MVAMDTESQAASLRDTDQPAGKGHSRLDPLVEALGQAITRQTTRERAYSVAEP
jgi:hypothetical protein